MSEQYMLIVIGTAALFWCAGFTIGRQVGKWKVIESANDEELTWALTELRTRAQIAKHVNDDVANIGGGPTLKPGKRLPPVFAILAILALNLSSQPAEAHYGQYKRIITPMEAAYEAPNDPVPYAMIWGNPYLRPPMEYIAMVGLLQRQDPFADNMIYNARMKLKQMKEVMLIKHMEPRRPDRQDALGDKMSYGLAFICLGGIMIIYAFEVGSYRKARAKAEEQDKNLG